MGQGVALKPGLKSATAATMVNRRQAMGEIGAVGASAVTAAAAVIGVGACTPKAAAPEPVALQAQWVGASHARGHRLRSGAALPPPATQRQAAVLIVGAGIAGLAAARAFAKAGVQDVQLLELEDSAGGNSRGHALAGMACPLGAHYLPMPGPASHEVSEWLFEIGLLKSEMGRTVADERHLCHSPQERLFIDGAWAEGLLPPAEKGSVMASQVQQFARAVQALQTTARGARAFAMPAHHAPWGATQAALNTQTFALWLDAQGITHERLRWYLDYCCRDDYGAGAGVVSAWAGVHYFASRHGFHAPGDEQAEREPVFTWPEGNAWLAQRLAAPFTSTANPRLHTGRTVLRVTENKHHVQVLAWDEQGQQLEAWTTPQVVLAVPLFIAARVLDSNSSTLTCALQAAASWLRYAPWLVANLHLTAPLLARTGAPLSWDNVIYGSAGLGYVDALHQSLRTVTDGASTPTVLTAYHALPTDQRGALLSGSSSVWAEQIIQQLAPAHPDLRRRVQRVDLMRWGHAMAVPAPGVQHHPALLALRQVRGRVRFAHADLAGYSVFEEAFTAGAEVASQRAG
jgi:predicted NAD/FAD-dependent oxidoreductase